MKYDHMVKVNGQYYPAGTEIPEPDTAEGDPGISVGASGEGESTSKTATLKRGRKPSTPK